MPGQTLCFFGGDLCFSDAQHMFDTDKIWDQLNEAAGKIPQGSSEALLQADTIVHPRSLSSPARKT